MAFVTNGLMLSKCFKRLTSLRTVNPQSWARETLFASKKRVRTSATRDNTTNLGSRSRDKMFSDKVTR